MVMVWLMVFVLSAAVDITVPVGMALVPFWKIASVCQ
jgi:hypothetical protein